MRILLRVVVNAIALAVTAWIMPGIAFTASSTSQRLLTLILVAVIFGIVNAIVKPIANFVAMPLIILTLGLMLLVVNALMLLLTSWLAGKLGLPFHVANFFWQAVLGGLILSVVSTIAAGALLPRRDNAR